MPGSGVDELWREPEPRPARSARAKVTILAVALLLVAVPALATAVVRSRAKAREAALRAEVERALPALEEFVAARQGAPFEHTVTATVLGDKAFLHVLLGHRAPTDSTVGFAATLVSLHLADPKDDPAGEERRQLSEEVYGLYLPATKRLYVRARHLTPFARMVLVHELTHAWQDQRYGIGHVQAAGKATQDEQLAALALIEGDARRIEDAWAAAQPPDVRAAIRAEIRSIQPDTAGRSRASLALEAIGAFPYDAGEAFATALAERGPVALETAYVRPPASTEQVLHPAKFRAREEPRIVDPPNPEAVSDVIDRGRLGELGLALLLGGGRLTPEALRTAAGWDGDAYVTWDTATARCTGVAFAFDDTAARDRVLAALRTLPLGHGGSAEAAGDRGADLRSCVP
jgi:hypothetical protein